LTPEGEPTQPAGRWLASPDTRARLGIEAEAIDGADFIALMEGRHPRSGHWLRPEGAGGGRGGGVDVTFSAPKSVSVEWALGDEGTSRVIEAAHASAVRAALSYITETVPTVRRRYGGGVVEECARDLIAAEYRHTTARSVVMGEMPDPQLHSHVVITAAVRDDGRFVAVASRPIFRSARDAGAYYSNNEIHRLNARAQHYRAERGELGELEVQVPNVHYEVRRGDRVMLIDQHHQLGEERIENGSRGEVLDITPTGEVVVEFDVTGRRRTIAGDDLDKVRLGYAQHIHRAPGRDRHPHARGHWWLADQQGARVC
jgi:conjugative relaxase-like TrwC/TraI family protein